MILKRFCLLLTVKLLLQLLQIVCHIGTLFCVTPGHAFLLPPEHYHYHYSSLFHWCVTAVIQQLLQVVLQEPDAWK